MAELTALERRIVAIAEELGIVAELCNYVEYDPEVGRVPEHFRPRPEVMSLIRKLYPPNTPNCQHPACDCDTVCAVGIAEHVAGVTPGFRSVGKVDCHISADLDLVIGTELFVRTDGVTVVDGEAKR